MIDGLEEIGLPPLGHNKPPEDKAGDKAKARAFELIETVNRWFAERPSIADAEQAGAAQLMLDQLRTVRDDLAAGQKADTQPLDDAIAAIKMTYREPSELVRIALGKMEALSRDWLQRERDRLAAEDAERKRQADAAIAEAARLSHEAEQQGASVETIRSAELAEQKAAELVDLATGGPPRAHIKGDYAKRAMGLRSNWKARVTDEGKALRHYAKHPDIRAAALVAVVKVASGEAKRAKGQGDPPPGVEWFNDERAT